MGIKSFNTALTSVAVGWACVKSWSGRVSVLRVRSPAGTHPRGNGWMFLSHIDVSLSFSLPPPLSKNK